MPLNQPTPGLRRLWNDSKQPAKVQVTIPPGDELAVSDDVAAQLTAASTHIKDGPAPAKPEPADDDTPKAGQRRKPAAKKATKADAEPDDTI